MGWVTRFTPSRWSFVAADTAGRWRPPLAAARAFRIGAPEVATFPFALWDRLARQASAAQRMQTAVAGPPPDLTGGYRYLQLERMAYYVNKDAYRNAVRAAANSLK